MNVSIPEFCFDEMKKSARELKPTIQKLYEGNDLNQDDWVKLRVHLTWIDVNLKLADEKKETPEKTKKKFFRK